MRRSSGGYDLAGEYGLSQLPIVPKVRHAPERRPGRNLFVLDPDVA
jgi:hypothetical protein